MNQYIALLRGINVSGQKKIKMVDLRLMMEKLAFENAQTYIQSGNVLFTSVEVNRNHLEEKIKKGIADTFGFEVPVLVKTQSELEIILAESPYTNPEDLEANRIYYVFFKNKPDSQSIAALDQQDYPNELFTISENCMYLNCLNGAGKAKLSNTIIERKLQVTATTRNHRTLLKLIDLAQDDIA